MYTNCITIIEFEHDSTFTKDFRYKGKTHPPSVSLISGSVFSTCIFGVPEKTLELGFKDPHDVSNLEKS